LSAFVTVTPVFEQCFGVAAGDGSADGDGSSDGDGAIDGDGDAFAEADAAAGVCGAVAAGLAAIAESSTGAADRPPHPVTIKAAAATPANFATRTRISPPVWAVRQPILHVHVHLLHVATPCPDVVREEHAEMTAEPFAGSG
jgi:hypothetical protein